MVHLRRNPHRYIHSTPPMKLFDKKLPTSLHISRRKLAHPHNPAKARQIRR
jgi:hypothetical protein